jgi:Type-F conjugative transfer system pilin assembly protein
MRFLSKIPFLLISLAFGVQSPALPAAQIHYVSFGMPKALLASHLKRAGGAQESKVIFRGLPEGTGYQGLMKSLIPLLKDLPRTSRPGIRVDPLPFEKLGITQVPVVESEGRRDDRSARYPILEPDPRHKIRERLQSLTGDQLRTALLSGGIQPSSPALPRTVQSSTRLLDPAFRLPFDLTDGKGHRLVEAQTVQHPLMALPFQGRLVIFDAKDPLQQKRIAEMQETTAGGTRYLGRGLMPESRSILSGSSRFKAPFYELPASWIQRLGLESLPVTLTMTESSLKVDAWPP